MSYENAIKAAIEHERALQEQIEQAADTLIVAAAELGWGSGIPWYDALFWLQQAATRRSIDVPKDSAVNTSPGRKPTPRSVIRAVWDRDGWECRHCGSHRQLTIDHIVPVAKGGPNTIDNLQTLCAPCNGRKSDTMPAEVTP